VEGIKQVGLEPFVPVAILAGSRLCMVYIAQEVDKQ